MSELLTNTTDLDAVCVPSCDVDLSSIVLETMMCWTSSTEHFLVNLPYLHRSRSLLEGIRVAPYRDRQPIWLQCEGHTVCCRSRCLCWWQSHVLRYRLQLQTHDIPRIRFVNPLCAQLNRTKQLKKTPKLMKLRKEMIKICTVLVLKISDARIRCEKYFGAARGATTCSCVHAVFSIKFWPSRDCPPPPAPHPQRLALGGHLILGNFYPKTHILRVRQKIWGHRLRRPTLTKSTLTKSTQFWGGQKAL